MAKKKSQKVARAPKAVKRGAKAPKRNSNGSQAMVNGRNVTRSSMPHPYSRISMSGDVMVVSGMEILTTVSVPTAAQGPTSQSFALNPANTQYLKRLSTHAFGYQKYRFRSLRLRYYTQCPSTQSGVISGVVLLDPLTNPPTNPQEYLAYAESFTRTVTLDAVSEPRRIVDGRWFYTANVDGSQALTDPTTRYQGVVCWNTDPGVSSTAINVGYLALEYVCEFTGHRPMRDSVLALYVTDHKATGGTSTSYPIEYDTVSNVVGNYDIDADQREGVVDVPGYTTNMNRNNSWTDQLYDHLLNYYFPISAATVDGKQVLEEKGFIPRPSVSLTRVKKGARWECRVGGAIVDTVPSWATVHVDAEDEEKAGELSHPVRVRDLHHGSNYHLRGNAAGDLTITWQSSTPSGTVTNISTELFSSGTGALTLNATTRWDALSVDSRLWILVQPTGVENRDITAGRVSYVADGGASLLV